MFCPNCRSEYRAGFTECGHCKVPLVASLESAPILNEAGLAAHFKGQDTIMITQGGLQVVQEVADALGAGGCVSRVRAMDEETAVHAMFVVEIVAGDLPKARSVLGDRWRAMVAKEGGDTGEQREAVLDGSKTECPACGTSFTPVDAASAECPECGLFLGVPA